MNYRHGNDGTVLEFAVRYFPSFDIIKLLLDNHANPFLASEGNEKTALDYAVLSGNKNLVKIILNHHNTKSELSKIKQSANLAFHHADSTESYEIFEFLNLHLKEEKITDLHSFTWDYYRHSFRLTYDRDPVTGKIKWKNVNKLIDLDNSIKVSSLRLLPYLKGRKESIKKSHIFSKNFITKVAYSKLFAAPSKPVIKSIIKTPLPFYKDHALYELICTFKEGEIDKFGYCIIIAPKKSISSFNQETYLLKGTSPPIHEINRKHKLKLTSSNSLEYLRFFCSAVHGQEGGFKVIIKKEDINWVGVPPKRLIEFIEIVLKNLTTKPRKPDEGEKFEKDFYLSRNLINYGNNLFLAEFRIFQSGMIEMINDWPLAADLSQYVEVFENGFRVEKEEERDVEDLEYIPFHQIATEGWVSLGKWKAKSKEFDVNEQLPLEENEDEKEAGSENESKSHTPKKGKTALRLAVDHDRIKFVKWLIKNFKNLEDLPNEEDGKTALQMAKDENKIEIYKILQTKFASL